MYVFDASSIELMIQLFPPRFKTLWLTIEQAIDEGQIISVYEAYKALNSVASTEWKNAHKRIFKKITMCQGLFLKEFFTAKKGQFQSCVTATDLYKGLPVTVPFVIACAQVNDAIVVSEDNIKNICREFGLRCLNFEGVMAAEGWEF